MVMRSIWWTAQLEVNGEICEQNVFRKLYNSDLRPEVEECEEGIKLPLMKSMLKLMKPFTFDDPEDNLEEVVT